MGYGWDTGLLGIRCISCELVKHLAERVAEGFQLSVEGATWLHEEPWKPSEAGCGIVAPSQHCAVITC